MTPRISRVRRPSAVPLALVLAVALVALMSLLPVLYILLRAREAGWEHSMTLVFRPRVYELLVNTLQMDVAVTLLCAVIGTITAWLIERTDLPGSKLWNAAVMLPFAVPSFIGSYSWVSILPGIEGLKGVILVMTLSNYPLVHLPVAAALRGMDPALEETSRSLGYSRKQTFFRVILPQLRPAILGGAILIALHMLAEFGALSFLNYETFTTAIFDQYNVVFDGASAAMLTLVLLSLCVMVIGLELLSRGRARYATQRQGAPGELERIRLGAGKPLALAGVACLVALAAGVPLGTITYWLLTGSSAAFDVAIVTRSLYTTLAFGMGGGAADGSAGPAAGVSGGALSGAAGNSCRTAAVLYSQPARACDRADAGIFCHPLRLPPLPDGAAVADRLCDAVSAAGPVIDPQRAGAGAKPARGSGRLAWQAFPERVCAGDAAADSPGRGGGAGAGVFAGDERADGDAAAAAHGRRYAGNPGMGAYRQR
nr:iron ABC transporter permease [Halomonas piscis]